MRNQLKVWVGVCAALAGAAAIAVAMTRGQHEQRCQSIDPCVVELRAMAHARGVHAHGMDKDEKDFVQHIAGMEGALPVLMSLLADPDPAVAQMAAKALRAYPKPIDAKYLPQVRAGLDRDLRSLPAVLGLIESDEAAQEAVARFLVSKDAPYNQEAFAVTRAGARAIPFILDAAACDPRCGRHDISNLSSVLADMGPERAAAAPGLLAMAQDPTASEVKVHDALLLLEALGRDAASTESALVALRDKRPSNAFQIDQVLISMHSRRAGAIFAERIREAPQLVGFRDIAEIGPAARDAGPAVAALLSDADPDVRLGAARALGFIDYRPAVGQLIPMLDDPFDVRVAWAAAESLGRLGDRTALPALERTAQQHWYPAVRETAKRAATSLRTNAAFEGKREDARTRHFPTTFFSFTHMGDALANCDTPSVARVTSRARHLSRPGDADALDKLSYPALLASDGAPPPPPPEPGQEARYAKEQADRLRELRAAPPISPGVALRTDRGWLAASNRGEFGGELVYVDDDGTSQLVVGENVEDLHVLGDRVIALAGLAHLTGNQGGIHEITRARDGRWHATPWRILPGAPRASWPVETGEVLIQLHDAGTVLVSADGHMRMAPCRSGARVNENAPPGKTRAGR